ncbi:hypothetical protein [Comamonas antarctica]|uniref:hypothetical protein n=1 Tax=Comamonas antarctica TaxID=2743470 RepID=UPI0028EF79F6|nr:hypothetical protein [Comamonas antarctica]
MAVNGIELAVGQRWCTERRGEVEIIAAPHSGVWTARGVNQLAGMPTYAVRSNGACVDSPATCNGWNLVSLAVSTPQPIQLNPTEAQMAALSEALAASPAGILEPVPEAEYTGGSVSYYQLEITNPTTPGRAPYTVECNDVIEALGLTFAEGNVLKALWRRKAAARLGLRKKGYTDGLYDAEKMAFFSDRVLQQEKHEVSK